MKTAFNCTITLVVLISVLYSCDHGNKKSEQFAAVDVPNARVTHSTTPGTYSGTADKENVAVAGNSTGFFSSADANGTPPAQTFIRSADVKFKVKNVVNATTYIENVINQSGGFVAQTSLDSRIDNTNVIPVSADSSLESTNFTVSNSMVLRVPDTQLDTTLKALATLVDYLDYRVIKADDVQLQLLSNRIIQDRVDHHQKRVTGEIDTRGKKLGETTAAEESLLSKQEEADRAKLANLTLEDQVNFSTVNLTIYQRPSIRRELIANNKDIRKYEPGLGTKLADSFGESWTGLESLLVFLVQIWWFIVLVLAGYFFFIKRLPTLRRKLA